MAFSDRMSYSMPLCFMMMQSQHVTHLTREKHELEYHMPVNIQVSVYHVFCRVPMSSVLLCVSTWKEKERVSLTSQLYLIFQL